MSITALFTNNRTQAIRLTAALRLPEDVKKAQVHARRGDRIIWPVGDSQAPFTSCPSSPACRAGWWRAGWAH